MLAKLQTFLSKKLAGTAGVVVLIEQTDVDPRWKVVALAVVGAAYVIGQAMVDMKGAK